MILAELFGRADEKPTTENGGIAEKGFAKNEQLEADKAYKQDQGNTRETRDPTAQRNLSPNGYTQRGDRPDQLKNLHISGSETCPPGATAAEHQAVTGQGPGLEKEGSDVLGNETRRHDQKLGAAAHSCVRRRPRHRLRARNCVATDGPAALPT